MLRGTKELERYAIGAIDGDIGHVRDFCFDDDSWVIRYLVVEWGRERDIRLYEHDGRTWYGAGAIALASEF